MVLSYSSHTIGVDQLATGLISLSSSPTLRGKPLATSFNPLSMVYSIYIVTEYLNYKAFLFYQFLNFDPFDTSLLKIALSSILDFDISQIYWNGGSVFPWN